MLEVGKRYRIKGTDKMSFWIDQKLGVVSTGTGYMDTNILDALATDNYEEIKTLVKKTFYQAVKMNIENIKCGWWRFSKSEAIDSYYKINGTDDNNEIIEREFEIEEQ